MSALLRKAPRDASESHIVEYLMRPLQTLLELEGVSELCINRPGEVWLFARGQWSRIERPELDSRALMGLVNAIANCANQKCDGAHPLLSCSLPTGERVQIVIPPAVEEDRVVLAFRKPSERDFPLEDYEARGSFAGIGQHEADRGLERELLRLKGEKRWVEFQRLAVEARLTLLACGETGSGKTTYLRSLCSYIDANERLITIEDAREMWLSRQRNTAHLLYSHGGQCESGTTSSELLKACMRLRPDRILPAELRGGEAYDFVDAALSGHRGSMSTLHAGDVTSAFMRFLGLLREADKCKTQSERELKLLAFCALDVLVIWDTPRDGQPRVRDIWYDPAQRDRARDAFMALA